MSSMKLEFVLLGTLALGAALLIPNHGSVQAASALKNRKDRQAAPDFLLTDSRGSQVRLSDYKGKVVVLNFWATWCGPCKASFPKYQKLVERFPNDLAVLAVSVDDPETVTNEKILAFARENHARFSILWDKDHSTGATYHVPAGLPSAFIIDRSGIVRHLRAGLDPRIAAEVQSLVNAGGR